MAATKWETEQEIAIHCNSNSADDDNDDGGTILQKYQND